MRRVWIVLAAACVTAIVSVAAIVAWETVRSDSGGDPEAIALPTACDNFVEATRQIASQGSTAGIPLTGGDVFAEDALARRYETLKRLLDACDAELAATIGP